MISPVSAATTATAIRSHVRETSGVERDERIRPTPAVDRRKAGAPHLVSFTGDRASRTYRVRERTRFKGFRVRSSDVIRKWATRVRPHEHEPAATRGGTGRVSRWISRCQTEKVS